MFCISFYHVKKVVAREGRHLCSFLKFNYNGLSTMGAFMQ